jgi:hypothetical protein
MMRLKYNTTEERENILNTTQGYCIGEENLLDGDFLVFDDFPLELNSNPEWEESLREEGREEIRAIVREAASLPTIGLDAETELKAKGVLPA